MAYEAYERETSIVCNDETKKFVVYTLQQTVQTKLRKAGIEPVKIDPDGACHYELDFNQISFRSGKKREMSEEQKLKAAERLRNLHKNKKSNEN